MIFGQKHRIYKDEFNKLLKTIPGISEKDRAYLNQVFSSDLIDGLTEFELREKTNRLLHNTTDILTPWEVEAIKRKILQRLGG